MRWIIAVVVVLVVLIGAGCTPQEQQVVTDNLGSLPDAARLALVEQTEGFLQPEAPIIRFTDPLQVVNPGLLNHVY